MTFSAAIGEVQAALLRSVKQIVVIGGGLLVALIAVSFLTANPLATFLRLLSLAGVVLMLLSVAAMLLTFRTARQVAPAALLASLVTTLVSTFLALAIAGAMPSRLVTIVALLGGGLLGAAWSLTPLLSIDGAGVRMRGTTWYLAVWALLFAASQGVATFVGRTPVIVAILTLIGVGLAGGNTLGLLWRIQRTGAAARSLENDGHA
jgi:hypothetical protein